MSIETEFESTITNVQNAYQGLDNLGATIPQNKTIENIKNCLDEIYNNLPKTDYEEGSNITLSNTLKGKLDFEDGIVGIGDIKQDSTQGYQLLNIPNIAETTKNGITYSCQNGILKLNGTATNGLDIWLCGTAASGQLNLESGAYTFAGQVISGSRASGVCGKYVRDTAGTNNIIDGNQIETYTQRSLTDSYSNCSVYLYISNGTVLDNLVVGISLVKGLYTQSTMPPFEKYTGGQASPNPSYPQDIEVVRGKNRLQLENGTNTTYNVTAVTENGKITLNGTPNSNTYSRLISTFTANTTDTFTLTPFKSATNSDIRLLYTINDGSLINSDNTPQISLTIGDILKVYLRISSTSQITNFTLQPQLEKRLTSYFLSTL